VRFSRALPLGVVLALGSAACSRNNAAADDGGIDDAAATVIDICDAFTGVGTSCPLASPVQCFPECEAGGCFCRPTATGPQWACETDLSCIPDCAPIDDACPVAVEGDGGPADSASDSD
jgi:hypothetical protein